MCPDELEELEALIGRMAEIDPREYPEKLPPDFMDIFRRWAELLLDRERRKTESQADARANHA